MKAQNKFCLMVRSVLRESEMARATDGHTLGLISVASHAINPALYGAKLSYGEVVRFNHGDLAGLERKLQREDRSKGAMIIVDGVYSMEGDIAEQEALRHG